MFHHVPVLLAEVLEGLALRSGGLYLDCTTGGAGHSQAILEASNPEGRLIGLDQDDNALDAARERLAPYGVRATLVKSNFAELGGVLDRLGIPSVDGILMDLGVSSHQLDEGDRGFSYHQDAPLDMRMDQSRPLSAFELVNQADVRELTRIISEYGEERFAGRIARRLAEVRVTNPIQTTGELAEIIKLAIPAAARREGPHPARRTFQALRIAVNDELGVLERGLDAALQALAPGGRLAVISFHSLEDRIVKQRFAAWAKGCDCPPQIPVCVCGKQPAVRLVTRGPVTATPTELEENTRSRSAKLRVAEKL